MTLRVLIVDDEPLGREALRTLLVRDREVTQILEAADGLEAAGYLEGSCADVVFLDVQMPGLDGLSLLQQTRLREHRAIVIFVTAHDQYALDAFENDAVDYLLKPVSAERFVRAFDKAKAHLRVRSPTEGNGSAIAVVPSQPPVRGYLRRVAVKSRESTLLLDTERIDWIRAADDYVNLHVGGKSYLLHGTLSNLLTKLHPDMFVRIHRSAAVNLRAIKEIHSGFRGEYTVVLTDGTEVRSGRTFGDVLRQLISNSV